MSIKMTNVTSDAMVSATGGWAWGGSPEQGWAWGGSPEQGWAWGGSPEA